MYKKSGNPKVEELTKSVKERSYNLSCLKPIKLEELNVNGKPKRLCAWCATVEIFHGNQKYCGQDCSNCAMAWAYPQKEDSLRYLLHRQNWKCIVCLYDYSPFLHAMMDKERKQYPADEAMRTMDFLKLPWHYFKLLKSRVPSQYKPEVDHVQPISKGGVSLGLDNHQAICFGCHKAKTKIDNSGPRKKT